jgi:DNA-binding GntR family transcriptional regulator
MAALRIKTHISLQDTIVSDIQKKIEKNLLKIGQLIPTEEELRTKYGVSRVTVRLALDKLEQKNLIFKKQGVGTFVQSKKIKQTLSTAKTIIDALREKNLKPKVRVLFNEKVKVERKIMDNLNIKENEKVIHLRRLVFLNDSPYALLDTYFPEIFKGVADIIAKAKNLKTTYEIFENHFDFVIKEAKYDISISKLGNEMSKLLKLKKDSYCLKNSRITYSIRGKPLEITNFYYPPEKASFEVILPRMDRNFLLRVK